MTNYNKSRPVIENGKLVFISNGGTRALVGVRQARKSVGAGKQEQSFAVLGRNARSVPRWHCAVGG